MGNLIFQGGHRNRGVIDPKSYPKYIVFGIKIK